MADTNLREERSNRGTGLLPAALATLSSKKEGGAEPKRYSFIRTVTIDRPASELWAFWRTEENAPRFMQYVKTVRKTSECTSHWVTQVPGGPRIEDSEIYEQRP
jgi:uncharacterized membrane protein